MLNLGNWPDFEDRRAHAFSKIRDCIPNGLHKGRFLDIGCGTGNGVIAAIQNGFSVAVGIDRSFSEFPWFDVRRFDEACAQYGIPPERTLLVEGDFFETKFAAQAFDCVMMLDSIEHLPDPTRFIQAAADYVSKDGVLIIDTCPLYYSRTGHHLFEQLGDDLPWGHLRHDFLERSANYHPWNMQRFNELNRIRHQDITDCVRDTGLKIILEHRDFPSDKTQTLFETHRHSLNLDGIEESWLFEEWIMVVAQRLS